ncbi:DUF4189 domain-containing protein [Paraburkholderia aspalathi]|uniref:DUF4189 domain-containing protein n=1 Tax=Paraburkholderia aspalathi TaxID=1324617 RepID=UPI000B8A570C
MSVKSLSFPAALLAILLLLGCTAVHAEGNCPQGYYPIGGGSPGAPQGCAPIPGYDQGQQHQAAPQWLSKWGAVATDIDKGSLGAATSMTSKDQAEQASLADCRAKGGVQCKIESTYTNGCITVVVGSPGYAVNSAPTQVQANSIGMSTCTGAGNANCRILYTGCSLPQRY